MGYYDQTDRHDSPVANAFDIGTLWLLFVLHEQVLASVRIEERQVGG